MLSYQLKPVATPLRVLLFSNATHMNSIEQQLTLSVTVYESISVSDAVVIAVVIERLTTWTVKPKESTTLISIAEYRRLLGDYISTNERIVERLEYLEAFCRNIIKPELEKQYE